MRCSALYEVVSLDIKDMQVGSSDIQRQCSSPFILHASPTHLDVFHEFLRAVLTVQHCEIGEDAAVSIVQTKTL